MQACKLACAQVKFHKGWRAFVVHVRTEKWTMKENTYKSIGAARAAAVDMCEQALKAERELLVLTAAELRDKCNAEGLPVGGTKQALPLHVLYANMPTLFVSLQASERARERFCPSSHACVRVRLHPCVRKSIS